MFHDVTIQHDFTNMRQYSNLTWILINLLMKRNTHKSLRGVFELCPKIQWNRTISIILNL